MPPGSCLQPMTDRSWCVNISASLPPGWVKSKECVVYWWAAVPRGMKLQLSPVVISCFLGHLPLLSPLPALLLLFCRIISQVSHMHSSHLSWFKRTQTKKGLSRFGGNDTFFSRTELYAHKIKHLIFRMTCRQCADMRWHSVYSVKEHEI